MHRHPPRRRALNASRAHRWVLARRRKTERARDPSAGPGERSAADPAAWTLRQHSQEPMQSTVGRDLLELHPSRPVLRAQRLAAALASLAANLSEPHPLRQREPRASRAIRAHLAILRSAPSRARVKPCFDNRPAPSSALTTSAAQHAMRASPDAARLAPAQDDEEHPRTPRPKRLLCHGEAGVLAGSARTVESRPSRQSRGGSPTRSLRE